MQASGLITCAKHYILYEQAEVCTGPVNSGGQRTDCMHVSSELDGEPCSQGIADDRHRQDDEGGVFAKFRRDR